MSVSNSNRMHTINHNVTIITVIFWLMSIFYLKLQDRLGLPVETIRTGVWWICAIFIELDTAADEQFADVVAKEKPMSARRRRRSNSNSKDEATNSYSDYSLPVSGPGSSMSMSTLSLPPPVASAGEMGCRDRTQEFRSITMSLRSNQVLVVQSCLN